jgi:hypothetical protein
VHEKPTNLHRPIDCADAVRSIAEPVDLDLVGVHIFLFFFFGKFGRQIDKIEVRIILEFPSSADNSR